MENLEEQRDEIRLRAQRADITPVKDPPKSKVTIVRGHSIAGTNTYRLGNFAKSLLEKAQSSDLKLSPTTIQALINPTRTRQIQLPGLDNYLQSKKSNVDDEKVTKCSELDSVKPENNENTVQSSADPSKTGPNPILNHVVSSSSPDRKITSEATTVPLMHSMIKNVQPQTRNGTTTAETPEIHTGNNTSPITSPRRPRTVPMPTLEECLTPIESTKIVTPVQTLMNPRMRTHPLLNFDEHSSELMVAYRQSSDVLSSEIRPYSHNTHTQSNKQESYTPQYRNTVNGHGNSEVAARIPPMLPLGEQNSNTGPRMYPPNQIQMGAETPVPLQSAMQKFRPPSSTGKGKTGNFSSKKPANSGNSWKFRSETVDGKEYLRMKELGKGGCGSVDLVIEKESRELYALKKVNLAGMDEAVVQECVNEIQMLMELTDTDLVIRIFSWEMNHVEKSMKIVMEYGQCDLNSSIKSINSSIIRLKYIWERLLLIVATIHSRGIVHADLKPANFVWVGDSLKIIDFGIANRLQSDHTSIATLNPKGTMNFISPETIRPDATGKTKISPKSDIWSLGCILYMMVYGKTPFQDITHYIAKINAISLGSVTYPNLSANLQYSGVLTVLKMCFELDPKARPTATELLKHPFLY